MFGSIFGQGTDGRPLRGSTTPAALSIMAVLLAWPGSMASAHSTGDENARYPADAAAVAAAFREICLDSDFSPAAVEAAFTRRGWRGSRVQSPTSSAPFSLWTFPFGDIAVGYFTIGGIELRQYSCGFSLRAAQSPSTDAVVEALSAQSPSIRFGERRQQRGVYRYIAPIVDRADHQETIVVSGDQVPFAEGGAFVLRPGILIAYSLARGRHARDAVGPNVH